MTNAAGNSRTSVVIAAYRAEPWIAQTLHSVLGQRPAGIVAELVIVDDASDDDTVAAAEATLAGASTTWRVIRLPANQGPAAARNAGWRQATGDWIQFLDADDLLDEGKIAAQARRIAGAGADVGVVYSPWQRLTLTDGTWSPGGPIERPFFDGTLPGLLAQSNFGYVWPCLIRRAALESVAGFDEDLRIGEDLDLMLRISQAGWNFVALDTDRPAVYYRETPGSISKIRVFDPAAIVRLLTSIHRVELEIRSGSRLAMTRELRRGLAYWYVTLSRVLMTEDATAHRRVMRWLTRLRVHREVPGVHRATGLLARAIGLGPALWAEGISRRGYRRLPIGTRQRVRRALHR